MGRDSSAGLIAHFGLGDATNVEVLRIEWPSGVVTELTNVSPQPVAHHPGNGGGSGTANRGHGPGLQYHPPCHRSQELPPRSINGSSTGPTCPGPPADTLVLNNIQVADAGTYTVEVSDGTHIYLSNPCCGERL